MKTLVIAGGTGFLGESLILFFKRRFDKIIILCRSARSSHEKVKYVQWDAKHLGSWTQYLEGATAIINLCGKNVNCRYTEKNKAEILSSRLDSTAIIGKAIRQAKTPPAIWINAASAAIYGRQGERPATENDRENGEGFMAEVCRAWEHAFTIAETPATRKLILRTSLVLGTGGGVYPVLQKIVKYGLGGKMGSGSQMVSWIHINDYCRLVEWCIDQEEARGAYNCTAPVPVSNKEEMKLLRKAQRIPFGLPATKWMLAAGAFLMQTETALILESMNVIPYRALKEGFTFKFETLEACVKDLAKNS